VEEMQAVDVAIRDNKARVSPQFVIGKLCQGVSGPKLRQLGPVKNGPNLFS
jgi:hypothetical protein